MFSLRLLPVFLFLSLGVFGAEKPSEFTNSLGMRFVEVPGTQVLFSIYETRAQDFSQFVEAEERTWPSPSFEQGENHPAVNISWEDAKNFCHWLTRRETENGYLPEGWRYRLPTEQEWMAAVSDQPFLLDEPGFNPELKFPWGEDWPPPKNAGNYSPELQIDDFHKTAPVGSFVPNVYGLFDMGGMSGNGAKIFLRVLGTSGS